MITFIHSRNRNLLASALAALVALVIAAAPVQARDDEKALWAAFAKGGGVVALMRHALAPGTGDPDNFSIGDCSTQRNLSDAGRDQARATGELIRRQGIAGLKLYSSQWCRCLETARLLGFGEPEPFSALNSLFARPQNTKPQMSALKRFINALPADAPPYFMVSHNRTILALTGISTGSGAIVLVKADGQGGVEVLGQIDAQPAG
jgi:phosphohistidine phosphatase SixA